MARFHARDFKEALRFLEQAATGPLREMAFSARTHLSICEQRLELENQPKIESAEDRYNYAVALLNERQYEQARRQLEMALEEKEADHFLYALAVAVGHLGDIPAAAAHLRRSIALSPKNRVAAHNDPDFAELARHSEIRALLHADSQG